MPRPRRSTGQDGAGFLLPFGRRPSLPGASCPARGFRPSYDRPTALTSADPSGVSMFRTHETRLGPDALFTPGTAVPTRPRGSALAAACRLSTAGPCHPSVTDPSRDVFNNGASARVHWRSSLPAFPSPVAPGRNGGPRAFPWAPHPAGQDPAAHARAGTSLGTARSHVVSITDLLRRAHSPRAASRRTNL
jgi:hypothetical protein